MVQQNEGRGGLSDSQPHFLDFNWGGHSVMAVGGYFSISPGNGLLGINGRIKKKQSPFVKSEALAEKFFITPFFLEN
mgnify:CR=1 FL=1|jgi:hypothetical protein